MSDRKKMQKQYTAQLKAKIVQEMLKEEKSFSQLASEYGVSTKQMGRWKAIALEGFPRLFEPESHKMEREYEAKIEELYAEVGRLSTELTWLKKKSGGYVTSR